MLTRYFKSKKIHKSISRFCYIHSQTHTHTHRFHWVIKWEFPWKLFAEQFHKPSIFKYDACSFKKRVLVWMCAVKSQATANWNTKLCIKRNTCGFPIEVIWLHGNENEKQLNEDWSWVLNARANSHRYRHNESHAFAHASNAKQQISKLPVRS